MKHLIHMAPEAVLKLDWDDQDYFFALDNEHGQIIIPRIMISPAYLERLVQPRPWRCILGCVNLCTYVDHFELRMGRHVWCCSRDEFHRSALSVQSALNSDCDYSSANGSYSSADCGEL